MKEPWASVLQGERLEQPLWDTQFLLVYSPWPARLIGSASAALTVRPWAFSSSFEGPTPCGGPCFSQWQRLQRSRVQRNKQNTHEGSRCQGKGNCLTILAWRPQGGEEGLLCGETGKKPCQVHALLAQQLVGLMSLAWPRESA